MAAIVESAWTLAREHGIAGVSLHALAREVGMRQPSLYAYFDSKLALYDAMFADGNRQLLERLDAVKLPRIPGPPSRSSWPSSLPSHSRIQRATSCSSNATYPDSRPRPSPTCSPRTCWAASYKLMNEAGVIEQGDVDCIVAMVAGLMEAQLSNDPGGNRWIRHLNRLVDLYVDDAIKRSNDR